MTIGELNRELNRYNDRQGIITIYYGNNKYIFWHNASVVYPYISEYLENEFSHSIILREFNKVDFIILKENLPCEVQSTPARIINGCNCVGNSEFEEKIEKQLKQNIDKYGRCLFFFDSEYLRYLQTDISKGSRINLDWFYRYIKEGKLRVFTVRYDGIIKEVFLDDFKFISEISQMCSTNRESDERILERNKFLILSNVLEWQNFSTNEFNIMYDKFKSTSMIDFDKWLLRDDHTDREELFHNLSVVMNINHLKSINNALDCNVDKIDIKDIRIYNFRMKILGLIDIKDTGKISYLKIFKDYAHIAQFFPGYMRNKELWDNLKTRYISHSTMSGLMTDQIDKRWYMNQKDIATAWESW